MSLERRDLGFQMTANVNHGAMRRERDWLPVGQSEIGGRLIKLLRPVRGYAVMKLISVTIRPSRPMKRQHRENSGHGMVGMAGDAAFRAECEHHLRTKTAHMQRQVIDDAIEFLAVELSVGVIENHRPGHFQNLARRGEFLLAHFRKLLVRLRVAAVGCRLSGRKADHAGFNSALAVGQQRAAEVPGLVVRMRGDAQESKHALIVSNMQSFAETVQSFAIAE